MILLTATVMLKKVTTTVMMMTMSPAPGHGGHRAGGRGIRG